MFNYARKLFQRVGGEGNSAYYGSNGVQSYDLKKADQKLKQKQANEAKARAKRQATEDKAKQEAAIWNQKHGKTGSVTTRLELNNYSPTPPSQGTFVPKSESYAEKLSAWIDEKTNDVRHAMGLSSSHDPSPAQTKDILKPVAQVYLDLKTPKQIDDWTEGKLTHAFKEAERKRFEEKYEAYQRHGGKMSIDEYKKGRNDMLEDITIPAADGSNETITLTVYKDFPALVAAGAPTPLEQLATNPWDKSLIIRSKIGQFNKALDKATLADVPVLGNAVPAAAQKTITVLQILNDLNESRVDEQARQMGWISPDAGKSEVQILVKELKDRGLRPLAEGAAETGIKPRLVALCKERFKLPMPACEKIADKIIEKGLDEGIELIPDGR